MCKYVTRNEHILLLRVANFLITLEQMRVPLNVTFPLKVRLCYGQNRSKLRPFWKQNELD